MSKNYKCPDFPEKCPTAMKCSLHDPDTQCPYTVKGKRHECCVSMGHESPPMDRNSKGFRKWMRENCPQYERAHPLPLERTEERR